TLATSSNFVRKAVWLQLTGSIRRCIVVARERIDQPLTRVHLYTRYSMTAAVPARGHRILDPTSAASHQPARRDQSVSAVVPPDRRQSGSGLPWQGRNQSTLTASAKRCRKWRAPRRVLREPFALEPAPLAEPEFLEPALPGLAPGRPGRSRP